MTASEPVQLGLLDEPTGKPQPEPEVEVPCSQLTELPGETFEDIFITPDGTVCSDHWRRLP